MTKSRGALIPPKIRRYDWELGITRVLHYGVLYFLYCTVHAKKVKLKQEKNRSADPPLVPTGDPCHTLNSTKPTDPALITLSLIETDMAKIIKSAQAFDIQYSNRNTQ